MKRSIAVFLALVLCALLVPAGLASAASADPNQVYHVATDDGASIAISHYRPESGAPFREGAQPVVFMPGPAPTTTSSTSGPRRERHTT